MLEGGRHKRACEQQSPHRLNPLSHRSSLEGGRASPASQEGAAAGTPEPRATPSRRCLGYRDSENPPLSSVICYFPLPHTQSPPGPTSHDETL